MEQLPDDIILEIWEFTFSNKDMIALRSCCKRFKRIGDRHGFIRHLHLSLDSDFMNLMVIWGNQNLNGLRSLSVNGLSSPMYWIPFKWPQHVLFVQCRMGNALISPPLSPTTELRIIDYSTNTLCIDWSKLPNLKLLEIKAHNLVFKGLEKCKRLEHIKIYLKIEITKLPSWIANLENLITLYSNLSPDTKMHFISKKLRICITSKIRQKNGSCEHFTADSTLVPHRHLTDDNGYYIM